MSMPRAEDKMCIELFSVFLVAEKPYRFNEFYRYLNAGGLKISKPTLSLHLKHLVDKELIVRTELDKQYVTYNYNVHKWGNLDEIKENAIKIQQFFEKERERFGSSDSRAQVFHVNMILLMQGLYEFKFELLKTMEPEKAFQHHVEIDMYGRIWEHFKRWMIENFKRSDDTFRKQVLADIEDLIKQYTNIAFETERKPDFLIKGK